MKLKWWPLTNWRHFWGQVTSLWSSFLLCFLYVRWIISRPWLLQDNTTTKWIVFHLFLCNLPCVQMTLLSSPLLCGSSAKTNKKCRQISIVLLDDLKSLCRLLTLISNTLQSTRTKIHLQCFAPLWCLFSKWLCCPTSINFQWLLRPINHRNT